MLVRRYNLQSIEMHFLVNLTSEKCKSVSTNVCDNPLKTMIRERSPENTVNRLLHSRVVTLMFFSVSFLASSLSFFIKTTFYIIVLYIHTNTVELLFDLCCCLCFLFCIVCLLPFVSSLYRATPHLAGSTSGVNGGRERVLRGVQLSFNSANRRPVISDSMRDAAAGLWAFFFSSFLSHFFST